MEDSVEKKISEEINKSKYILYSLLEKVNKINII